MNINCLSIGLAAFATPQRIPASNPMFGPILTLNLYYWMMDQPCLFDCETIMRASILSTFLGVGVYFSGSTSFLKKKTEAGI